LRINAMRALRCSSLHPDLGHLAAESLAALREPDACKGGLDAGR
jgi:hypothetical protein